jgi:hypothetical protein
MYQRARYKEYNQVPIHSIKDPVATLKRDGAHFFLQIDNEGNQKYYSRRPSVKGGHPERSAQIPHLSTKKLPEFAGQVFSVELIHTGHNKNNPESHVATSGILNSLPARSILTQENTGPIRAVLIDVIDPPLPTYRDKLLHMKSLEKKFGNPEILFVDDPAIGIHEIQKLAVKTKAEGREGIITTSLSTPEPVNTRIKLKHFYTYNLRVNRVIQEFDISGNPKDSMGALECTDATGRIVCYVGTGFSRELRQEIWKNPSAWIGKLIQVKTMGLSIVGGRLRAPSYNGDADGEISKVEYGSFG